MEFCMQFILLNEIIMEACIRIHLIKLIDFTPTSFAFNCQDLPSRGTFTRAIGNLTRDNFHFQFVF